MFGNGIFDRSKSQIKKYLDSEKLSYVETSGEPYSYKLDKTVIETFPEKWSNQSFDYNKYLGKTITEYSFEAHGFKYQGKKYDSVRYTFITCNNKLLGGMIFFSTAEKAFYLNLNHEALD